MIRSLFFMAQLLLIAGLMVWAVGHPGTVRVEWLSYAITVHIGLFFVAALVVLAAAIMVYRLYSFIVNFPRRWKRHQADKARQKGWRALSSGLSAVAAGDAKTAQRLAGKARYYLPEDSGLVLLLEAQAARMAGNHVQARLILTTLMDDKAAGFLGMRGMVQHALDTGDLERAHSLVQQALQRYKHAPWILQVAYHLAIRLRDWNAAYGVLDRLESKGILTSDLIQQDRVALLIARADFIVRDDSGAARRLLDKAYKINPTFPPLLARRVELYLSAGQRKKAQAMLKKAWSTKPHPQIASLWNKVIAKNKAEKPMARIQWAERLIGFNAESPESFLAVADVMLAEGLWGEARDHLMQAKAMFIRQGLAADGRVYDLLAKLERKQKQDETAAQEWLALGRQADVQSAWVCSETGRVYDQWAPVAEPHGAFNTIFWQQPGIGYVQNTRTGLQETDQMVGLLGAA